MSKSTITSDILQVDTFSYDFRMGYIDFVSLNAPFLQLSANESFENKTNFEFIGYYRMNQMS